jgi:hypothetical protein
VRPFCSIWGKKVGRLLEADKERTAIATAADTQRNLHSADAALAAVLCDLDRLIDETPATPDSSRASVLVEAFRIFEPAITRHLTGHMNDPVQAALAIAKLYPY